MMRVTRWLVHQASKMYSLIIMVRFLAIPGFVAIFTCIVFWFNLLAFPILSQVAWNFHSRVGPTLVAKILMCASDTLDQGTINKESREVVSFLVCLRVIDKYGGMQCQSVIIASSILVHMKVHYNLNGLYL